MTSGFLKFPSTPHLAILGDVRIRGDKVMSESERDEFLLHELVVEEKVDGANLGISFDNDGNVQTQNRGTYLDLPSSGQWKGLTDWLCPRLDSLFEQLNDRYVLFGEWCYAQHSVFYDRLPDWFLGFDVYDKQIHRFLSYKLRNDILRATNVCPVPTVERGRFTLPELGVLLSQSEFSEQPAEGLYLRVNHDNWLARRSKLVRPTFIQSIEQHWSRSGIKANRLMSEAHRT
ncbi:MAG: RNA ligase family protein [Candidatus Nealsonbacteria bacterium]|nr:RNA ligase family protein [Candidatus Nealsonbacteria bacterium]